MGGGCICLFPLYSFQFGHPIQTNCWNISAWMFPSHPICILMTYGFPSYPFCPSDISSWMSCCCCPFPKLPQWMQCSTSLFSGRHTQCTFFQAIELSFPRQERSAKFKEKHSQWRKSQLLVLNWCWNRLSLSDSSSICHFNISEHILNEVWLIYFCQKSSCISWQHNFQSKCSHKF